MKIYRLCLICSIRFWSLESGQVHIVAQCVKKSMGKWIFLLGYCVVTVILIQGCGSFAFVV